MVNRILAAIARVFAPRTEPARVALTIPVLVATERNKIPLERLKGNQQ